MIGRTISHYRVLSRLGAGGMGDVYVAEDTRLDRKVAIKVLPAKLTRNAENVSRFIQEAKAASALNHPNIITVHDVGESGEGRFIVMELVSGRTLRSMAGTDRPLATLMPVFSQMARAIAAAHADGITHRDVKPENIMVRDDGYVKVLDFGLARLSAVHGGDADAAATRLTESGLVMGTVKYMSPEQGAWTNRRSANRHLLARHGFLRVDRRALSLLLRHCGRLPACHYLADTGATRGYPQNSRRADHTNAR